MAIDYDFLVRPGQSLNEDEKPQLYPKAVCKGTVTFDTMAKDIEHATGCTTSDVVAVMTAMREMIADYLNEGMHVELEKFGTLSVNIAANKGADGKPPYITSPSQLKPHQLHVERVVLNAKPEFMAQLNGPFERARRQFASNCEKVTTTSAERRTLLLNDLAEHHAITISRYILLTGLTRQHANAEIAGWVGEGIIRRNGIRPHLFFTLAPQESTAETRPTPSPTE